MNHIRIYGLIFFLIFISGCFNLKSEPRKISYYSLEYDAPRMDAKKMIPAVIRLKRFQVSPLYDSTKIIYREGEFERDAYIYHKWWSNPGDIVTYFLARDIRQTRRFKAVFDVDRTVPASHIISGTVDEFFEQDMPDSWKAVLSVSITLMTEKEPDVSKKILLQKKYSAAEPCNQKTPRALAEAMSSAMAKISEMVIRDIYGVLESGK